MEKKKDIVDLEASFANNRISIYVPEKISEDKELFLLIEKDIVYLDHTFEDQSDNYLNSNKVYSPEQE